MTEPRAYLCGVIEGFYGRPWTHAQRLALVQRLGQLGLNTYLYAPKDDLRHRARWRELYPAAEASLLGELISACAAAGVQFVYAVAPGLDPDYSSPAGRAALERKVAQLHALGARDFAVLFDDIIPAPASGQLGATEHDAAPQVAFAHQLATWQQSQAPDGRLLFCPTPYCERMSGPVAASRYLAHLGATLDPAIDVLWTGPEIISETITPEHAQAVAAVLRRPPVIWDNLFANDYDLRRIYLGPYAGRPRALRAATAGVLLNPNCEFEANHNALHTLGAWNRDAAYEPAHANRAAWQDWQAAWRLAGETEEMSLELLQLLGDCLHLPCAAGPRAQRWRDDFAWLVRQPPQSWGDRGEQFFTTARMIGELFDQLTRLENRDLLHTVYRHVWELKEEANLLVGYLRWQQTEPAADARFWSAEHRRGTYRGGLVAELQRQLPMRSNGSFDHRLARPDEP
jgi:protein O-GlcNAcase/histone acetyltransferase